MVFSSYEYILAFLPAVFLGYLFIGRFAPQRFVFFWLIAASLFFYGWWNPIYLALILGSAVFNFLIGMYFGIQDTVMVHENLGVWKNNETYQRILEESYRMFRMPGVQSWWREHSGRVFAPRVEAYLLEVLGTDRSIKSQRSAVHAVTSSPTGSSCRWRAGRGTPTA